MKNFTIVMAYYDNHAMLQEHLFQWRKIEKHLRKNINAIIVDDGSPNAPARLDSEVPFPVSIYRMLVDIRWNQDACRNIGVRHAETEWVLMTDMDHVVPPDTARHLIECDLSPQTVYKFSRVDAPNNTPYKPHPNSWFMTRAMFDKIGGYDERLAGWYGTDGDFLDRVQDTAPIIQLNVPLVRYPREIVADASTTSLTRKTPEDAETIRRLRKQYAGTPPERYKFPYERVL